MDDKMPEGFVLDDNGIPVHPIIQRTCAWSMVAHEDGTIRLKPITLSNVDTLVNDAQLEAASGGRVH